MLSGNGAYAASIAGSRRTAVTTSSGVSGRSRAEPASAEATAGEPEARTESALWRATCLGSSTPTRKGRALGAPAFARRAGSVVVGSDAIGNDVQSYTINRRKRNDCESDEAGQLCG